MERVLGIEEASKLLDKGMSLITAGRNITSDIIRITGIGEEIQREEDTTS